MDTERNQLLKEIVSITRETNEIQNEIKNALDELTNKEIFRPEEPTEFKAKMKTNKAGVEGAIVHFMHVFFLVQLLHYGYWTSKWTSICICLSM